MKGIFKMKKTIISSVILLILILITGFIFENKPTKISEPDSVCVYLNGNPVNGAVVRIGNVQKINTTSSGCAGITYDSGTYCVTAEYGGYSGCVYTSFTPSPNQIIINLSTGQCNCPD